ncbi:N-acetylmuramoyl-L-alanine amidase [Mucilaginibacter sp. UR6-11]|uniref:N-acetylmuramoyl-L-alanine amidase n=1 Tax=Mucilaginibacter sp. UR6-11 TaxID=1435644 RepID=UPI001E476F41|nr:N-acetylmuramoyl-L-alanine amidase [Mucilaginibacter sp. UR6-11]MCC8426785.1 N-acetylmuramoyl-L-alanine amidase [Mucilaginibacter sp. UR6-11]
MINYRKFHFLLFIAAVFVVSCSPKVAGVKTNPSKPVVVRGPHFTTDSIYTAKTDSLINLVKQQQPVVLMDSTGLITTPSEWVGSVNFGIRKANYVIIHFTAQDSVQQTIKTFTIKSTEVSAHYVVGKDGKVYHMVNDYLRSNHAGFGKWGSVTDMNSISLGIEMDNNGSEPFTDAQIKSLLLLLAQLKKNYNIPTANFIGHQDFAPKRKPDPGPLFPWKLLAANGFGYWSDDALEIAPLDFDYKTALRLIGYDTTDLNAAIIAFKRHFVQDDSTAQLSQLDLNVLYNVYQKY